MTPSQLKELHLEFAPNSKYFTRETMKFMGDTMKNYGVRETMIVMNGQRIHISR
jgi:hypothetical protein